MADADPDAAPDAAHEPLPRAGVRKVHHLSCGSACLVGQHDIVCHVLLVETEQGLVLVDTGLGVEQVEHAPKNTGRAFQWGFRPKNAVAETAVGQVKALGYAPEDVRHIILTHLDFDHAGGLPDFPQATVHVHEAELAAGIARGSFFERARYQPGLWAHDVKWQPHTEKGERWYGFPCVRDLPGLPPEILLVPLHGHTRGHAGIAVDVGGRWILHCGDAYFHKDELVGDGTAPALLAGYERIIAVDDAMRVKNQQRLRELARGVGQGISVFCAHDPDDLARMREE